MITSRQAAWETIYKVIYSGAYSNLTLGSIKNISPAEHAFAARLALGVIERKLTLDYIIEKFCRLPKPRLLVMLEMGVYQLYFMEKVPASAAINESVKLARQNSLGAYTSFVNAVLRRVNDNRLSISAIQDKSIKYSVPQSLISMWEKAYSQEKVDAFLPELLGQAPVFAVPNVVKAPVNQLLSALEKEKINAKPAGNILQIDAKGDITKSAAFKDGLFYIEDLSSYSAVAALAPQAGDVVLDMCSAPGGKSFAACILMNNSGRVYSFDIHEHRISLVRQGAERLGLNITAAVNDARSFSSGIPAADKIICDVPCSGFGVIRRKPEIKYKNLDEVKAFPPLQLEILSNSAKYLKAGGSMLYSTCTLNKKENEQVLESFLKLNKNFKVLECKTLFPSEGGADGFFYAVLKSNG